MAKRGQLVLCLLILTGAFAMYPKSASALSDRMVVTRAGVTIFDQTIDEANPETSLTYQQISSPSTGVFLIEPPTEPPDPTETPVLAPGSVTMFVSDMVVGDPQTGGVEFFSDGFPGFADLVQGRGTFTVIDETGGLQDVTTALGIAGITVQVQSDVVPEPSTLLLLGGGLTGFAVRRARATERPRCERDPTGLEDANAAVRAVERDEPVRHARIAALAGFEPRRAAAHSASAAAACSSRAAGPSFDAAIRKRTSAPSSAAAAAIASRCACWSTAGGPCNLPLPLAFFARRS